MVRGRVLRFWPSRSQAPRESRFVLGLVPARRYTGARARFDNARGEWTSLPPELFPWEFAAPVGTHQGTGNHHRPARGRRPRPRICLRKGCGRKYQPRTWNQRYCQDPECLRLLRQWQAAWRQARRRKDPAVKAQHAQVERARRLKAKAASQAGPKSEFAPARGHAPQPFFPSLVQSARLLRAAGELPSQPGTFLLSCLSSGRSQRLGS